MSKATPGPWQNGGRYGLIGIEIQAGNHCIAVVNRVASKRLDCVNGIRSAQAKRGEQAHQAEQEAKELLAGEAEALANARLMIAAPDLFNALGYIADRLRAGKDVTVEAGSVVARRIEDAVAKAEGL